MQSGEIDPIWISTDENLADIFTKPMKAKTNEKHSLLLIGEHLQYTNESQAEFDARIAALGFTVRDVYGNMPGYLELIYTLHFAGNAEATDHWEPDPGTNSIQRFLTRQPDAPNWQYIRGFDQLEARMQMHTDAEIDHAMNTYDNPSQYGLTDMDYYEV